MPKVKVKLVGSRFHHAWLDNQQYKSWLPEDKTNSNKFYCKMCKQNISLSNMGVAALRSHVVSKKNISYKQLLKVSQTSVVALMIDLLLE